MTRGQRWALGVKIALLAGIIVYAYTRKGDEGR